MRRRFAEEVHTSLIVRRSEFDTILGEEHCRHDENNAIDPARHPPNWTSPARRMAEMVARLIQLGHPPNWTGPAWRMAELVARSVQLGHPSSWTVCFLVPGGVTGSVVAPSLKEITSLPVQSDIPCLKCLVVFELDNPTAPPSSAKL
ncbi:hypothetical protein F2Q70_00002577 [Brassica cretica]|uniref:Uncharacterized protein n=1 Tax=Brassica cretica TaxID=69181 RepID=A0A8S9ISY4_BRACR|nr:hypothetical protein F2Q70_00002577 [Brassica cretica]